MCMSFEMKKEKKEKQGQGKGLTRPTQPWEYWAKSTPAGQLVPAGRVGSLLQKASWNAQRELF